MIKKNNYANLVKKGIINMNLQALFIVKDVIMLLMDVKNVMQTKTIMLYVMNAF